uniref:Uncharacterized protein n=1 Tax=Aureoumbra lagunensis TaxID=44058 RepID=A0A7S3JPI4_9STRA
MTDLTASALLEAFMTTPYLAESGQCDNILSDYAQDGPSDEDGPELMDLHRNSLSQHMSSKNIERTQEETVDEEGEDWSAYDDDTRTIDKEVSMLLPSTLSKKEEIKKVTPESAKGGERWWRSKKTETLNEMSTGITKKRLPCNVNIFYDGIDTLPNQLYLAKPTPRNSESQGEFEEEGEEINEDGTPACSVTNALRVASSPCSTDKTVDDDVRMNSPECNYKSNKMLSISRRVLALSWDEDDEQLSEVQLCIFLVDGGSLTVKARTEDRAHSVLSAAALRLGLAAEHVSALALYAVALDGNPEHRFVPGTPVAALRWLTTKKKSHKLVLAARLLTPQLLKVAARGFKREAPPNELALAKLLYAQAVARVMASNDSRVLPPLFPPLDTKNNNNLGEEKMFSQDDNEDTEWLRVDNYLRPRHDCPDRSEGLASALRLGALRLWARAVDACTLEPGLSIISAAVRLVRENGAIPFIPKLDSPEKDWHWETQLLEELDYLLKILNSQRIAKENRNISSNQATNINGEGITIEVFDSNNTLPESSGGTERYENSEIRTIFQVEPATPIISPRQSMTDEFSFLLPAACYLRLVSINYENFGSVRFACCARRRASSEKMMETDPSSPVSAKELFSPNTEKDIPNDTTGYTANRTLSISANGIAISSSSSITPLLNVPFTKLRRWICDAQTNTVRLEAEEPFDPFDEAETSTSPGQANRLLNGLTSSSKTTHLKANERFANRTRRKLRKSIRAAASLPPPRTPRSQRMRDESTKKETAMESADITSVAHGGGFGAWARSLFSSNSPATKEESIGQKNS